MAGYGGPRAVDSSLVFGYDTGYGVFKNRQYTRLNKGEPTTNLIPTPSANGRFTTSNSWGTYNTNQYNGNSYFSIGTIGSVSSNIVTLSSVGRTIRTYDVLRPQTTGGGVTAGTNYFIRKLSDTTFTLHAYNSSQNGSQGYINTSTGKHKVHDSIWNDERISINSTSFPTMWWGAPHLPNSGLVKEIVEGGGYEKGTNCMRWHIHRGDSVADGMAYGVYTPVTAGDVITVSYWVKPGTPLAEGKTVSYTTYFGSGNSSYSNTFTLGEYRKWQQVIHTWTASVTYNFYQYWFPQASTDIYYIDVADLQVEVNKGHATPFTLSSRSSTEGLLDMSSNDTSINLNNVSFDSTGLPTFDGTDDRIVSDAILVEGSQTFETVFMATENPHSPAGILTNHQYTSPQANFGINYVSNSGFKLGASIGYTDGSREYDNKRTTYVVQQDVAIHAVLTYDETNNRIKWYINGELDSTHNLSKTPNFESIPVCSGRWTAAYNNYYFDGYVYLGKIYNKELSADEVQQNYNTYKNRFGL
jgi:hypothetical protein